MTSSGPADHPSDTPMLYEIRVRGAFDATWCDLADGMTLEVVRDEDRTVSVIHLVVQDQAALAGLMDALFGLGATVLSVITLELT